MEVEVKEAPKYGSWKRFGVWLIAALILSTLLGLVVNPWDSGYKSGHMLTAAAWHLGVGVGMYVPIYVVVLMGTILVAKLGEAPWGKSWASIFTRAHIPASVLVCIATYFIWYGNTRAAQAAAGLS